MFSLSTSPRVREDQPGFTLIELLVVVAIIALLLLVLLPLSSNYGGATDRFSNSRDSIATSFGVLATGSFAFARTMPQFVIGAADTIANNKRPTGTAIWLVPLLGMLAPRFWPNRTQRENAEKFIRTTFEYMNGLPFPANHYQAVLMRHRIQTLLCEFQDAVAGGRRIKSYLLRRRIQTHCTELWLMLQSEG